MNNLSAPDLLSDDDPAGITLLTLNRPQVRNALDSALLDSLIQALSTLARNSALRALIITGAGTRAFCAGADLSERHCLKQQERTDHTGAIADVADALSKFPVPTIACVNGYALAGGAELAIACDLRIANRDAVFGFPEVQLGIFPGAGGVIRLPRLIGPGAARDLLYTGRRVEAQEAFRLGLVDRLVDGDDALPIAKSVAGQIAANAPLAVRALKQALIESAQQIGLQADEIVAMHRMRLDGTDDYAEGLLAFTEKRRPRFRAR